MKVYEAVEVIKKYAASHEYTLFSTYKTTQAIEIMINTLEYFMEIEVEKALKIGKKDHRLKTLPIYFNEVLNGNKTFEVRFNDRDFKVGDILHLEEFENQSYTGRVYNVEITYILTDIQYCKDGFVILGFKEWR